MPCSRQRALPGTVLLAFLQACAPVPETAADPAALLARVIPGRITAPDSVTAGWKRLRVIEEEGGHIVVLFSLTNDALQLDQFVAAMDTARATPEGAVARGGPEVGSEGEIELRLTPGRYVLTCLTRNEQGHRHATGGEARVLVVTAGDDAPSRADTSGAQLRLTDFAYIGLDTVPAGKQVWRITNVGAQDHQLRLARLKEGVELRQWLDADDPSSLHRDIAGMARLGAGQSATLPLVLEPGRYVIYCLIPDAHSKRTHVELGMFRGLIVR